MIVDSKERLVRSRMVALWVKLFYGQTVVQAVRQVFDMKLHEHAMHRKKVRLQKNVKTYFKQFMGRKSGNGIKYPVMFL
jgi:hypothetical protein